MMIQAGVWKTLSTRQKSFLLLGCAATISCERQDIANLNAKQPQRHGTRAADKGNSFLTKQLAAL